MRKSRLIRAYVVVGLVVLLTPTSPILGGAWNGIEPFKTRGSELERILGKPTGEGPNGALRFNVAGGSALISFVDAKFVATKRTASGN